jgi:predicted alpha/beta-hydrolase family hydrolase
MASVASLSAWAVGSDPSVVVIDKGAGASIDSTTLSEFTLITIPHYVVIVASFDAESSSDREGG